MLDYGTEHSKSIHMAHYKVNDQIDWLGTGNATKTDEFSEKFQTAFDPSRSFS